MIATRSQLNRKWIIAALAAAWLACVALLPEPASLVIEHIKFSGLGLLGAIFANSTGAGGGVVFMPAFHQLGFSAQQSVATSFAIQCFGMTAGAISWTTAYRLQHQRDVTWTSFYLILAICVTGSVVGIVISQYANIVAPAATHLVFSVFSILLGLITLYSCKRPTEAWRHRAKTVDLAVVAAIGLGGGVITAWLSVGVGELLAVYLILRGYHLAMAIAAAVVVSAITVWSAIPYHLLISEQVQWQVVLFAGPCAVLGGILARTFVTLLPVRWVKLLFAVWVLLTGIFTLVLST